MKMNSKKRRYRVHRCSGRETPDCANSNPETAPTCGGCGRVVGDCWFLAAFDDRWDWICECGCRGIRPGPASPTPREELDH